MASREIGFTILSMTLSLAAVFIPVLFMRGIVGRLLHEFAVTIVVAILISGFVSLTLTPMLCSRFLRIDRRRQAHAVLPDAGGRLQPDGAGLRRDAEDQSEPPFRDAHAGVRDAGGLAVSVLHNAHGIHSEPGLELHVRHHAGRRRTSFESMVRASRWRSATSCRRQPDVEEHRRRSCMGAQPGVLFCRSEAARRNATFRWTSSSTEMRPMLFSVPGILAFMQNPPPITVSGTVTARACIN